jgi:hypothetical protein
MKADEVLIGPCDQGSLSFICSKNLSINGSGLDSFHMGAGLFATTVYEAYYSTISNLAMKKLLKMNM